LRESRLRDEMSKTDEVVEFLSKYSLEDVLSGIIEMQMLLYGHGVDSLISASEYFATNALFACKESGNEPFEWEDYLKLEKYCKEAFAPNIEELFTETLKMVNATDEEKEAFLQAQHMKVKNMAFRGDGYIYQLISFAEKLYSPLDQEIKTKLGFSFTSCKKMILYIFHTYGVRVAKAYSEKYKVQNMIKAFCGRTKPQLPSIKEGYIFRINKKNLRSAIGSKEVDYICDYLSVKAFAGDYKKVDLEEFKILISKPFVDFGEYIYMPLLFSSLMNLPKLFHYTFIAEKIFDKKVVGRYTQNRGDVVENLTQLYFERIVNKENILRSLKYTDEDGEADVTVCMLEGTLFCECKSKILTLNALKGINDDIKKDVYKAIGAAYAQGVRSIKRIQDGKSFIECVNGTEQEVHIDDTAVKYIICVTAENFGIIPSEIAKYVEIDKVINIVPYVVNIYDLDIITQECDSYEEFLGYLNFRQINHKLISAVDELDVFGFYKEHGNREIEIEGDELHITAYTKLFDRKYVKKDKEYLQNYK